MDRPLAPDLARRQRLRRWAVPAGALVLIVVGMAALPSWLRPTVSLARLRTARVVSGPIDTSISASGLIVPAVERVMSSPLDARVLRILKRPGATVRTGDSILELDVSESQVALQRAQNDLAVKENQQTQTRLGYEKALSDLDGRVKIKSLELETKKTTLAGYRELGALGLISKEELRKAELAVQQADIELAQLTKERENAASSTAVQLEGLSLERSTLDRDLAEKRRLLELATTKADRDGVLTWVVSEEGGLVRRGDVMARIADLRSYRVDATVSDVHAGDVRAGLPALVRLDDVTLTGHVTEVYPTVENGTLRFTLALDDSANARLRPSLRAEVQIVTDRKSRALKVRRGPFADGPGAHDVFVLRDGEAVRTPAQLGLGNVDDIEVVSGLREGDEVVISDMRDYHHLARFRVR